MDAKQIAFIEKEFDQSCSDDPPWSLIYELLDFAKNSVPIPVTERLPENHDDFILVWCADWVIPTWHPATCNGRICLLRGGKTSADITHWLPMPPSPE